MEEKEKEKESEGKEEEEEEEKWVAFRTSPSPCMERVDVDDRPQHFHPSNHTV